MTVKSRFTLWQPDLWVMALPSVQRGSEIFAVFWKLLSTVKANCVIIRRFRRMLRRSGDGREDGISKPCPLLVKKQKKAVHQNCFDLNYTGKMSAAIS